MKQNGRYVKSKSIESLKIKIFADGADLNNILELNKNPIIKGFTTNPTLMRAAGIYDYESFAKDVLEKIKDKSISFEVFADDKENIIKQAEKIASWQRNVSVKIPIMNTNGVFSGEIIEYLSKKRIPLNITAIMTSGQVSELIDYLNPDCDSIISVFAGRIADTGINPEETMNRCKELLINHKKSQLLWASPREIYNIYQAELCGCDIITVPHNLLSKLNLINKDLLNYSKETVKMFFDDASKSGFTINT